MDKYQPIIGLEIHVELKTNSKMFCQCSADYFGKEPNTNVCPVCLGMPGALPVPNKQAVEWTIKIGQALNCTINTFSKFDRKHYFYPDLPKGYQISQYDEPIAVNGYVEIGYPEKRKFRIRRVHLEEDTGKLLHQGENTLIDFNRSTVPLVEIVTEPDFDNSDDVKAFLEELHTIIRYLDVSNANMEEGSMRLEPNISVRLKTEKGFPPYKVEVKNINSFNYVKKAVDYELKRHIEILEEGTYPAQETRGYNETKGTTYSQRTKEEAHDYRYFPEPDIPPMEFTAEYLSAIKETLPELPYEKCQRYMNAFGLKYADAFILTRSINKAKYFEDSLNEFLNIKKSENPHMIEIKMIGDNLKQTKQGQIIANLIINKKISTDLKPKEFAIKAISLTAQRVTDKNELENIINKILELNPKVVADYKSGKQNAIMFLVGQVMREMKGKADAGVVRSELHKKLA